MHHVHDSGLNRPLAGTRTASAVYLAADIGSCGLAEGLLQEDVDVFHELAEGTSAGVFLSHGMVFTYVNPAMSRLFGYEPGDFLGRLGILDLVHHEDWAATEAYLNACLDGDSGAEPHTFRGVAKSGAMIGCTLVALKTEHNAELGLIGIVVENKDDVSPQLYIERINQLHEDLLAPGGLQQRLKRITDAIVSIFGADFARIWITRAGDLCNSGCIHAAADDGPHVCRSRDRCLHLVSSSGRYTDVDGATHRRVPFGCYKIGRVAAGDEPKFITNDVANDPRVHDHDWARRLGLAAFAGYRVLAAGREPKGVLALFSKHVISPDVDALLETLANTTAQVILTAEAEEALRESEERYSKLFRHCNDAIFIHDMDGNIVDANQRALKLFGYPKGDILSMNVSDLHPTEALQESSRAFEVLARDGVVKFEILFKRAGGETFPAEVSASMFSVGDREIVQGIVRDITARKQAEEALRRSEENYRLISENVPVAVYSALPDEQSTNLFVSGRIEELTGYSGQEFIEDPKLWTRIVHPDDRTRVWDTIKTHRAEKISLDFEYRIITKQGDLKWIKDKATPMLGEDGEIIRIDGFMEDITERRAAVDLVRRSEQELMIRDRIASIFLTVPDDVVYGEVLKVALEATQSQHGFIGFIDTEGHLVVPTFTGDFWDQCRDGEEGSVLGTDEWHSVWGSALREKRTLCANTPLETPEGTTAVNRILTVPMLEQGSLIGTLAVANKATDYDQADRELLEAVAARVAPILEARFERDRVEQRRRELQEEKDRMQAKLSQVHKMEAVGRLAGGVAHDFSNLLSTISGYCDLAIVKADEASAIYRDLTHIREAAGRAASLTSQLLLFGRKQPMEISLIDVNAVVRGMLDMLSRLIGEDISMTAGLDPQLWSVRGDRTKIEQAILNLVVNAKDAMPDGGCIVITTENVTLDEAQSGDIPDACSGKYVCLSVSDQGKGMDQATLQHIFEPFFTAGGDRQSSGLGLSVAHGIVKQHGGWINAYSELGKGSTFKVFLAALASQTDEGPCWKRSLEALRGNGERVLVVEDEDPVRELVMRILGENNYSVVEASGADEALKTFTRENGEFDLVLSDVVLADDSGVRLVEKLQALRPGLRVLLNSGYNDEKSQWPLICERGLRFLHKPFSLVDLLNAVKAALGPDCETA